VPGHADQPRPGIGRHSVDRPSGQRGRARILDRVLSHIEVPDQTGHGRDRAPPMGLEQLLDPVAQVGTPIWITSRTSTDASRAAGMVAAQVTASSKLAHSTSV
jgi:hypothetical protein